MRLDALPCTGVTFAQRSTAAVAVAESAGFSRPMFAPWLAPGATYQYESLEPGPSLNGSAPHGSFCPYTKSSCLPKSLTQTSTASIANGWNGYFCNCFGMYERAVSWPGYRCRPFSCGSFTCG